MTNNALTTEFVQIFNEDLAIDAYLAYPVADGSFAAIIVIQEIFGVNDHIQAVTRRLAQLGYVAIAPAIYQRQAPGFTAGYSPKDIEIGRIYKNQTKASELLSDIQATIDYLYTLPQVQKTGVGSIGFCFGGHVSYLAATLAEIKATASFYGAGIANWCPGENYPTITRTSAIEGTLYGFFGNEDPSIPPEHVEAIESALQKHHIPHQIFRYNGAEHGFFCDQRESYNPEAATDAWEKVKQLFATTLK